MDSSNDHPKIVRIMSESLAKEKIEQFKGHAYSTTHHDRKYLPGLDTSTDRVFPIRSVVSSSGSAPFLRGGEAKQIKIINEHPTTPTNTKLHDHYIENQQTGCATPSMPTPGVQQPEISAQRKKGTEPNTESVTHQYKHEIIDGGHALITGLSSSSFRCGDDPIRTPGTIQSFGVMIAMREEAPDVLVVRVASENSEQLLGYTPKQLFELPNFCDILNESQSDTLLDHLELVRDDAYDPSTTGPEVFPLSIPTPSGEINRFWCAAHISESQKDIIICELELEVDNVNPLNNPGEDAPATPVDVFTPATPVNTMGQSSTPEQLAISNISISQPLRIFRGARRRTGDNVTEMFSALFQIQQQIERADNLEDLLNITAGLVKELTGFHKVMIYQFDSNWSSLVVAEVSDPRMSVDLYKGLHFPASDISVQARELYRINKVRTFYDRDQVTSRLVCRTLQDLEAPLDMTHAYLRSFSPAHAQYLGNLGVRSSMSISVNAFNGLWGLISCHSYGTVGMRVSFPLRRMCYLLGDTVSRSIERLSYTSRLQARKLINTVPSETNPSGYIVASSHELLQLFDADCGALCINDETNILGNGSESSQEILALVAYLRLRPLSSVLATHSITRDFPDLQYGTGLKTISGLLFAPLSENGSDFLCLFRKANLTEIQWAGNPYKFGLNPRDDFTPWRETILSQAREWSESDIDTAATLCLVYGQFIRIWRQREDERNKSHLSRMMLACSANEVRTPLNAIIHYLELTLEGNLDPEIRESLMKSHSASKSLIYVINDLLDLTRTEKGQNLVKDEQFDLRATFKDAADMMAGEAKTKNISYRVAVYPGVPDSVLGDERRIRQMFLNVISNAVQHTDSGAVTVEMWPSITQQRLPGHVAIEAVIVDTGVGMSKTKMEALFQELEQVSEYEYEKYVPEKRVLGLGLALVARIIHNTQGQLGVQSVEGRGSQFRLILQFKLPNSTTRATHEELRPVGSPMLPTPCVSDHEFTLGARASYGNLEVPMPVQSPMPPTPLTSDHEFTWDTVASHGSHEVPIPTSSTMPPTPLDSDHEFPLNPGISDDIHEQRRQNIDSIRSEGNSLSRGILNHADRLIKAMQESSNDQLIKCGGSDMIQNTQPTNPSSPKYVLSPLASPTLVFKSGNPTDGHFSGLSAMKKPSPMGLQPLKTPPTPGTQNITGSGVPMGSLQISNQDVKCQPRLTERTSYFPMMPIEEETSSLPLMPAGEPKTPKLKSTKDLVSPMAIAPPRKSKYLHVLVAEDDIINSKIIQKRLTNIGHTVHLTSNGKACAHAYELDSSSFDIVLMDIQVRVT
ncbi:hypothetical protein N7495_002757 [Penicillium taxi]|uniref:uncharacterized protein n=1 Tax=Penicillium taxi TaxID=168475 RepID=UPI00254532D0|nr:uncharacterized protein N7495_002757 [Penicillium taxi]KAJ5902229.1 hypothetical protein N7495_002757 [Penicillium taxi]